jgi:hypothetical protein
MSRYQVEEIHPALQKTLHALGSVTPNVTMNERLLRQLRLAATEPQPSRLPWNVPYMPRLAAMALAGSFACSLIVVGSVEHSHRAAPQAAPVLQLFPAQSGVGTASAARIAADPAIAPAGRGRAAHRITPGRASLRPGARPHGEVAVPAQTQ